MVSHQSGTTRDYLTAEIDLDGVKCRLIDTAGLDQPLAASQSNTIEHAAQLAADAQRRASQIQVLCLDSTRPMDEWERGEMDSVPLLRRSSAECSSTDGTACEQAVAHGGIVVLTKCDVSRAIDAAVTGIETSSRTGQGVQALRGELRRKALAAGAAHGGVVASTAARCRESLRLAAQCLRQARSVAAAGQEELAAAEIRVTLQELGKVVGAVYTDDILDRIFSRFCVGK